MTAPTPATPSTFDVDEALRTARILVCCGSGGVGKTTTAAALALRGAELGRRTVVLTIDPAKRLAQSMGLSELDNTPRSVAGVQPLQTSRRRTLAGRLLGARSAGRTVPRFVGFGLAGFAARDWRETLRTARASFRRVRTARRATR